MDSQKHPKHMFKLMDKKIIAILSKLFLVNWPYVLTYVNSGSFRDFSTVMKFGRGPVNFGKKAFGPSKLGTAILNRLKFAV